MGLFQPPSREEIRRLIIGAVVVFFIGLYFLNTPAPPPSPPVRVPTLQYYALEA